MDEAESAADPPPAEGEFEASFRLLPEVERVYRNDRIAVYWEPKLCIHVGECFGGLPEVFEPAAQPWVNVDGASPEEIAEVVSRCPTGALHFERLDGGAQEPEPDEITIQAKRNGPLFVRGRVKLLAEDGRVVRDDTRIALCRCGHSANKPFCDGSHRKVRFRTSAREGAS